MGLDGWLQALLETPNQYFFVKGHNRIKLFKHGLQMFQVGGPVYDVFLLVLSVLFN